MKKNKICEKCGKLCFGKVCKECIIINKRKYICLDCGKTISYKSKGRCRICANNKEASRRKTLELHKGKNNPNYKDGKTLKPRVCTDCGVTISYESAYYGGSKCRKCANKDQSKRMLGSENTINNNWKSGKSFEEYPRTWGLELKEKIRNRDNRRCTRCNIKEKEAHPTRRLEVHHKDWNKKNCNEDNLTSLCKKCHIAVHMKQANLILEKERTLI